ncbi:MAG: SWIM zinc finger family protein [Sandaracinaceae bacterium]
MKVEFKYAGQSGVVSGLSQARLAMATNQLREATYFDGELGRPLVFREALAALHAVVVSDHKYRPKDRLAFKAWLEEQDRKFLDGLIQAGPEITSKIESLEARLSELNGARDGLKKPFFDARRRYFDYAYESEWELEELLDPVITVHPDELAFEAFSKDESSYARLAAKHDLFKRIDSFEHGTTNVDFSVALATQLDRMRSYRETRFTLDPSGFSVQHGGGDTLKEKKITLPESWVEGFLQVNAVMSMGLTRLALAPIDLFNLCRFLRRHKAKVSPRALRWELRPGQRAEVVFEPWEHRLQLSPTAIYEGPTEQTIRTWGRDRLQVLERLVPVTERAEVHLAGTGLPSVFVCDLGDLSFTLGLSGWTDNDWTTGETKLDLFTTFGSVDAADLTRVYEALRARRYGTDVEIAGETALALHDTRTALSLLCRAGRAMRDLPTGVYRHRDLFLSPFSAKQALRHAKKAQEEKNPKAKAARQIFDAGNVRIIARRPVKTGWKVSGSAKGKDGRRVRPLVSLDPEGQIVTASCTCTHATNHGLKKGPCEHMLALRLAHMALLTDA